MTASAHIRRMANGLLVIGFIGLLCAPAWSTYNDVVTMPPQELAALAAQPMWKVSRTFPGNFEAFFDEQFGFRQLLLGWCRHAKVNWLHVSTSPRVALGVNHWLFYSPMAIGADHPVIQPFTPETLERWACMFQARHDWLAERGTPYVVLIAPDKQTIYPEALPRGLRRRSADVSRLDQMLAHLREHTSVQVIDLRAAIREAKSRERLYAQTDSHWNDRGAYVAYAELIETLNPRFPTIAPVPREQFDEVTTIVPGGDCARLVGLPDHLLEVSLELNPQRPSVVNRTHVDGPYTFDTMLRPFATELPDAGLPRAVMFHDSFGGHLVPFLSEHFRRIVYAWERPDYPIFDSELIVRERPDIVIQQLVERKLAVYCPDGGTAGDPRCETPAAWSRCSDRAE